MSREEMFNEINKRVPFVEANFYLNNPGLYGILINVGDFVAYKNYGENQINQSPTEWAQSCRTLDEAYEVIMNKIELDMNNMKGKIK